MSDETKPLTATEEKKLEELLARKGRSQLSDLAAMLAGDHGVAVGEALDAAEASVVDPAAALPVKQLATVWRTLSRKIIGLASPAPAATDA